MVPLSADELLKIWEEGAALPSAERALALLVQACPDQEPPSLAELTIGQRDWRLLTLRQWTFGPQIVGTTVCPKCDARLELIFDVEDIRAPTELGEPAESVTFSAEDFEIRFRLPNSQDLAAIPAEDSVPRARQVLLERCFLSARRRQEPASLEQLPERVLGALIERMAELDPQANVLLAVSCPSCDRQWQAVFDIVSFFWNELDAWAQRLLRDVHALASAYGWREKDIVAMSPTRRQIYMDMIGS
jgi:hypothetical protein